MALMPEVDREARQNTGLDHEDTYDFCDEPGERFMKRNDESVFIRLCDEFYKRVFADEDKFFRDLFASANMEDASQNLCEYLVQRFGGSNEYSNRNGIVNLTSFHAKIGVTEQAMRRWLQHMDDACDELDTIINPEMKQNLMQYFRHVASTFVVATERMEEFANMKIYDELPVNNFPKKTEKTESEDDDYLF